MKKIIFLSLFAPAAITLNNCTNAELETSEVYPTLETITIDKHYVSRDKAIAELQSFLDAVDSGSTRSAKDDRRIHSIDPITTHQLCPTTRTTGEENYALGIDTMLYLVNFEDEKGSAILAATDYFDPVIAVTDEGNIDFRIFKSTMNDVRTEEDPEDISTFIAQLVSEYCRAELLYGNINEREDTRADIWYITEQVGPLTKTKWEQGSPYDIKCPEINGERCAVGCAIVAMAQLTACLEFPKTIDGNYMDWSLMKSFTSNESSTSSLMYLTDYLILLGSKNYGNADYKPDGTNVTTQGMKDCMHQLGYKKVTVRDGYDKNNFIKNYIGIGKPVLIRAEGSGSRGHVWLLDGYMKRGKTPGAEDQLLFHTNFGYGGRYDGYYANKVFEFFKAADAYDPNDLQTFDKEESITLNKNFKYITYGDPNK